MDTIIRDFCNPDTTDPDFPFARHKVPSQPPSPPLPRNRGLSQHTAAVAARLPRISSMVIHGRRVCSSRPTARARRARARPPTRTTQVRVGPPGNASRSAAGPHIEAHQPLVRRCAVGPPGCPPGRPPPGTGILLLCPPVHLYALATANVDLSKFAHLLLAMEVQAAQVTAPG